MAAMNWHRRYFLRLSATAKVGAPDVRFLVMPDIMRQLPAIVFLAAGFGLGYRRWIRPRRDHIDRRSLRLLLLLILASMAGFIGSPFWWFDVQQSFAWDLPPLASRMLAAAGVSLTVGAVLALERPSRQRVRLYLILLVAYMVPLVVVVLAFHLDRFDFSAPITYGFFAAVATVTIPSVLFLHRQPQIISEKQPDDRSVTTGERTWLSLCGAATGVWGLALLVSDDGPLEMIWVWPGDLLSSRLIAVMLLALAAGCLYSAISPDVVPMMLLVIAVYGAMVPLATAANLLSDKPVKPAYVVAFTALSLGSVVFLGRSSRRRRAAVVLQ